MSRRRAPSPGAWVAFLCLISNPAWADQSSRDALKAEVELLRHRLAQLEAQVSQVTLAGTSGIGEKPVAGLLELPSGLRGLGISGYAEVSYIYNFAESDAGAGLTNRGRVYDTESNGFTPHVFELVLEKPATDAMPIGFRADVFAGDDADAIGATGLADANDTLTSGDQTLTSTDADQFDLQQAYITYQAPLGRGLEVKAGKFITLLGAEVFESPANWNFSRSYLFGYAEPGTHTGVLATYAIGEHLSLAGGVVNGWDIVDDNNKGKSLLGGMTLTPTATSTVSVSAITGPEQADNNRNDRTAVDVIGTWQATERLALQANFDFGHESGVAQGTGAAGFDSAEWAGLALYAKYDLTPTWALATRFEWFDDKDNVRTLLTGPGATTLDDIDFYEWTLTSQWKLYEHVLARLEYRHDKADERVFFHDADGFTDYQDTIAAELIYHF